jgi:DNA polymerase-3 subunit gamma/tau
VHHAYLFAGTRGVGKTTVARILAKCLNCECGVSATPCGECASCREIDAGRSVDVIEVDAASRTKVDDTRDLLDNVQYAPTRSRYKIYLIDEVHMLSLSSFNALLKTLEEPPPHVKFLLATTDPRKLPVTVLSRCLQFNLKRLPVALIGARLQHVLQAENVPFEPAAVQLLAQAGDGSLRDALSLLDQLLAYGDGKALEAEARAMLGTVGRDEVVQLARLLAAADAPALLALAQALDERASDHEQLLEQLAALLERVALRQIVPDYQGDELHPAEVLAELARAIDPEDVQLYYQTAIMGKRDLAHAPDAHTGFRMTLLRMLAFRPGANVPAAGARAASGSLPAGANAGGATAASAQGAAGASVAPPAVPAGVASPRPLAAVSASDWPAILAALDLAGAPRQLAANCVLLGREGATVRLALDPRSAPWRTRAQEEKLVQALSRHYGSPVRVEIEVRESQEDTPARSVERAQAERREQARVDFDADPTVEAFKQRFGASVIADTVRPSDPER